LRKFKKDISASDTYESIAAQIDDVFAGLRFRRTIQGLEGDLG
jgi:hypothetical protein